MKPLLCIFLTLLSFSVFSQTGKLISNQYYQNHTPDNPKSTALGSFGNIPVNYYVGQPEISLPLATIASRELSIPISINYDASGVRTDDMAGPIGFKWQLNAGGYVARMLTSLPDESPGNGYLVYASSTNYYQTAMTPGWTNDVQNGLQDSGPDEFVIVINGRSIKFVFDKYGNAMTIPRQNVKISKTIVSGKITTFELIDENGIKYVFGGTTESIEERGIESLSMSLVLFWDTYEDPNEGPSWPLHKGPSTEGYTKGFNTSEKIRPAYNSRWYLKQVISPSGDHIDLNYLRQPVDIRYVTKPTVTRIKTEQVAITGEVCCPYSASQTIYANRKFSHNDPGASGDPEDLNDHFSPYRNQKMVNAGGTLVNQSLIIESSIRLTSIEAANGAHLDFESSLRDDLPTAYKYDRLKVYNHFDQKVNEVRLNYATINADETNENLWVSEAILLCNINLGATTGNIYAPFGKTIAEVAVSHPLLKKYVLDGLKAYNYKRIFLESVDEISGTSPLNKYSFVYSGRDQLRRRTTPLFNSTGFPRDLRSNPEPLIKPTSSTFAMTTNSLDPVSIEGATNITNVSYFPTRGMLTKIKFPTQGSTEFTYSTSFSSSPNLGVKLTLIRDVDENGITVSQKEIDYSYNEGVGESAMAAGSYVMWSYQEFKMDDGTGYLKKKISSSSPQNEPAFTKGAISGNRQVKVYQGTALVNNGWEVFTFTPPGILGSPIGVFAYDGMGNPFTNFRDSTTITYANPLDVNKNGIPLDEGFPDFNNGDPNNVPSDETVFPFVKKENKDHLRGLLVKHTVHDKTGTIVKSTINNYTINPYNYVPHRVYGLSAGSYVYTSEDATDFWEGHYTEPVYRYRFGRYKIKSDWVVLDKTTEWIYDQINNSKSVAKVKSFVYDPANLQLVKVTTSQSNDPATKLINETKYVTHSDYVYPKSCATTYNSCLSGCAADDLNCRLLCEEQLNSCVNFTGSSEADALMITRKFHQVSTPVETQTFLESQGTNRLISSTVTKYAQTGGIISVAKPTEVWNLSKPMTTGTYTASSVLSNGEFNLDQANMRKVHSFDSRHLDGTLTQQTSLDGSVSSYLWDGTHTFVSHHSVNPGPQQHQSIYIHKPMVGVTSVTDPNSISSSFEYDLYNRLKLTKDHAGQITNRYRYHYLNDVDNKVDFTYAPQNNNSIQFTVSSTNESTSQYTWDFGTGTVRENASASENFNYATSGPYTVKLIATHPEFPTSSVAKIITILPPVSVEIISPETGSTRTVNCATNPTTICSVSVSGGPYTYQWQYSNDGATWTNGGTSSTYAFSQVGPNNSNKQIRCKVTDGVGNSRYSIPGITIFYSCNPGGGGGPTTCPPGCTELSNGNCACENVACGEEGSGCHYDSNGVCVCP